MSNIPDRPEYTATKLAYESKYRNGYGLQYPDGHVIRFHHQILEYELQMSGGKILDYGCGSGIHLLYFQQHGYTPFGCDIIASAIEQAKVRMPTYAKNFHAVSNVPKLRDYFTDDFDIIFSNQVLYYLNDNDIKYMTSQFYEMLKPGGVFFATMMASTNYYHNHIVSTERGLSKVVLKGRLNDTTYINFKTKAECVEIFKSFTKLHLGFYGSTIREDEGSTDHIIFIGRK